MGYGDEFMALGEAEAIHRATGSRVLIVDRQDKARTSPVWEHHPAVAASEKEPHRVRLTNCPGARPYIKAWAEADGKPMAVFSAWRAESNLGHLVLTPAEAARGQELRAKIGPYVVVEPHIKAEASPNKDWGFDRFQDVVRRCPELAFVQMGPVGPVLPVLEGATFVRTDSFRHACGVLAYADAYLGPEGGLHHAAAALRRPAAVIFGSFISPDNTGYSFHSNFYVRDAHAPCGRWARCPDCFQALERIQPEAVAAAVRRIIAKYSIPDGGCSHAR